jgi:hypothetical protein
VGIVSYGPDATPLLLLRIELDGVQPYVDIFVRGVISSLRMVLAGVNCLELMPSLSLCAPTSSGPPLPFTIYSSTSSELPLPEVLP